MTVAQLREKCSGTVKAKDGEQELLEKFWAVNSYVAGSYDTQRDFELLSQEMAAGEKGQANRLFYLALPPSVFKPVTSMLKVRNLFWGLVSKSAIVNETHKRSISSCQKIFLFMLATERI